MNVAMADNTGASGPPLAALANRPSPDENGALSKGEFAVFIGVTPGRVSQYIAGGKISGEALIGDGRGQRIHVERAKAQLRQKLDASQMAGNGLDTKIKPAISPAVPSSAPQPATLAPALIDTVEEQIKRERLEELKARNRKLAEEEAARAGRYVETESVKQQLGRQAGQMVTVVEASFPEIATDIATQFKLPQRDVLHALRNSFRKARGHAAEDLAKAAAALPEGVEAMPASEAEADEVAEE